MKKLKRFLLRRDVAGIIAGIAAIVCLPVIGITDPAILLLIIVFIMALTYF